MLSRASASFTRMAAASRCSGCSPASQAVCQFSTTAHRDTNPDGSMSYKGLNKYSRNITKPKDQGASQVCVDSCLLWCLLTAGVASMGAPWASEKHC